MLNDIAFEYGFVNLDSSLYYAKKALKLAQELNYLDGIGFYYYNIGIYNWRKGLIDSTIFYCKKSLEIYNRTLNNECKMLSLSMLGIAYADISSYDKSIKYYFESLDLYHNPQINQPKGRIYNNIGYIYIYLNNYEKSLEYFKKAYKSFKLANDSIGIAASYINMAESYEKLDSLSVAIAFFQKAKILSERLKMDDLVSYSYSGMAITLEKLNQYDSALIYHKKALDFFQKYGNKLMIGKSYIHLAKYHYNRNNLKTAIKYIKKGIPLIEESENILYKSKSYHYLSKIKAKQNKFTEAYKYLLRHKQLEDSLKKMTTLQNLAVLEAEFNYKTQKDQMRLKHQELINKQKITKKVFLGSLFFISIIVLLISYQLYQRVKRNKVLKKANDTRDKMMQLIAHDFRSPLISMGNNVKTIPYLLENKDYIKIKKLCENDEVSITRVLALIDNLINWTLSQHDKIPYKPEKINLKKVCNEVIEIYVSIADFKKIKIIDKIQNEYLVYTDLNILKTIIRNILNNAIKFTPENGVITINAERNNSKTIISVQDTGIGISSEKINKIFSISGSNEIGTNGEKGNGFGLSFCKEFAIKNQGDIWVNSVPGKGSVFYISVPSVQEE